MYVIGNTVWNLIQVKIITLYDGKMLIRQVDEIFYNIDNNQCTIFNNYEDAEQVLNSIKKDKIKVINDSIIGSLLHDHLLDVGTLKIYRLVPTEMCE